MNKPEKNPMDFFSDAIKKVEEREQELECFKAMRRMYLDLRKSGFTMIEAMTFMVILAKQAQGDNE